MRYRYVVLSFGLMLAASACAPQTMQTYKPKDQDETFIVSMLMKIPNGIKARSVELILQPYADNVYVGGFQRYIGVASSTAPLTVSKRELRMVYTDLLKSSKDISMTVKDFQLNVSGNRAVAEARTELILQVEATKKEERQQIFLNDVVWRMERTPAGWKIVEEIWQ
jgi:hypothetical protein